MRTKFAFPFFTMIVLVGSILLVETETSRGAPQFKKGKMDPGKMFDDRLAQGRSFFIISELPWGREELEAFAKENKITDGKITKEQYLKYWDQRDAIREKYKIESPFGKKGKKNKDKDKESSTTEDPKKKAPLDDKAIDEEAEKAFTRYDENKDNFLNAEEIKQTRFFKSEWEKWDENKDKLISLSEWKTYYRDMKKRMAEGTFSKKNANNNKKIVMEEEDDEEHIMVYRLGKLPKGIPDWFTDLDTDKDGQISLFEWQKGGKDIEEFVKMDRNDDGFLTAEEFLFFQRVVTEASQRTTQVTSTITGSKNGGPQKSEEGKGKGKGGFKGGKKGRFGG